MEQAEQQLDIETLLGGGSGLGRQNDVFDVLSPRSPWLPQTEQPWKDFSPLANPDSERHADKRTDVASICEVQTSGALTRPEPLTITVRGCDIGDLPTEYEVNGLEQHELPVIEAPTSNVVLASDASIQGTYVDPRVCVGFRYCVRNLSSGKFLFKGKALPLHGIGMGYGKRMTFKGEKLNKNSNYFYSDTQPDGYGFSLVAVEEGDIFDVCDEENCVVGRAKVESVDIMQTEIASKLSPNIGAIEKHAPVTLTCVVTKQIGPHGLLCLQSEETLQVSGIAVILKERRSAMASTIMIKDVTLPAFGLCRLCQPQVPLLS